MEAIIHTRVLRLYGSITRLGETSVESNWLEDNLVLNQTEEAAALLKSGVKYNFKNPYSPRIAPIKLSLEKSGSEGGQHLLGQHSEQ